MRKYIFLFSIFFSLKYACFSRVLFLSININDCSKCKSGLIKSLSGHALDIPTFIIYPDYELATKLDIYKQIDTSIIKVPILFNDDLYEKYLKNKASGAYYFNSKGKFIKGLEMNELSAETFVSFDSLYNSELNFNAKLGYLYKLSDSGNIVQYDFQSGTVKIYDFDREIENIILDSNIQNKILDSIKLKHPRFYNLSLLDQKVRPLAKTTYSIKPMYFDIYGNDVFYTIDLPVLLYHGKDTVGLVAKLKKESDEFSFVNEMVIVHFHHNKVVNIILDEMGLDDGKAIIGTIFRVIDDSSFLLRYGSISRSENVNDLMNYIARFRSVNSSIKLNKYYNLDLPLNYKRNNIDVGQFSFIAFSYPFFVPSYSNSVYDLEHEKVTTVDSLFGLNATELLIASSNGAYPDFEKGKVFKNQNLFYDVKKGKLYLFSQVKEDYYCTIINSKTYKVIKSVKLNNSLIPFSERSYPLILVDSKKQLLYLEDNNHKLRVYPLAILEAI